MNCPRLIALHVASPEKQPPRCGFKSRLDKRAHGLITESIDATILHAPSTTKNASGERDPEMHQTRKGKQWYFGLKAHIGVDAKEGTVHSVATTAASVADCHMLPGLLHGDERKVWGDGGYQGQTEAIREVAPKSQDMTCKRTRFKKYVDELQKKKNRSKSRVRDWYRFEACPES